MYHSIWEKTARGGSAVIATSEQETEELAAGDLLARGGAASNGVEAPRLACTGWRFESAPLFSDNVKLVLFLGTSFYQEESRSAIAGFRGTFKSFYWNANGAGLRGADEPSKDRIGPKWERNWAFGRSSFAGPVLRAKCGRIEMRMFFVLPSRIEFREYRGGRVAAGDSGNRDGQCGIAPLLAEEPGS